MESNQHTREGSSRSAGQDIFGNQFAFDSATKKVAFFSIETGEKETVASNFTDWVNVIFNGLDYFTGHKLAYAWRTGHGLQFNERLCPIKPFVIGGDYKPDNLYAIESSKNIKTNANIARQIYDRPNGTPITIKVINSGKEK